MHSDSPNDRRRDEFSDVLGDPRGDGRVGDAGPWQRAARGAGLLGASGDIVPTIFARMSARAAEVGAINLGQGFPDQPGPEIVLDTAQRMIREGLNQYSPGRGHPDLIEAIIEHQQRWYGIGLGTGDVLVTTGASEALAATLLAYLEPGDEVVVFEPYYDLYAAVTALAGARLVPVSLDAPEFVPDLDRLRDAFSERTRIVLLNTPHNPTGAVFDTDTLATILELAERWDALIVTDEVYEHLTFDDPHVPIATLPGAGDRVISISSAGKTFSTTGWKIGWITASAEHIQHILAVKQYLTFVSGAPFQPAIAAGLRLDDEFFETASDSMARRKDLLSEGLLRAGFAVAPSRSGYFVIADAAPLGIDADALCASLPDLVGVAAIPVTAFVSAPHRDRYASLVRFAFCKHTDTLVEASRRLQGLRGALED